VLSVSWVPHSVFMDMFCTQSSWTCSLTLPARDFRLVRRRLGMFTSLRTSLRDLLACSSTASRVLQCCVLLACSALSPLDMIADASRRPSSCTATSGELASLRTSLRDWPLGGVLFAGIMDSSVLRANGMFCTRASETIFCRLFHRTGHLPGRWPLNVLRLLTRPTA
jgi:hypothetical protein